jgi:nickel transport protein
MLTQRAAIGLVLALFCGSSAIAYAHKVNVFAYVEGDQIYVQGYFSDGTKAKNSDVTVYRDNGQELTKGRTDEDGAFTFNIRGQQSLRIVLNAGQGHQASYVIPTDEITGTAAMDNSVPAVATYNPALSSTTEGSAVAKGAGNSSQISEAEIRKAVAQGVLPLAREISELKERRGLSDIVGGIGMIVGFLGVLAYVKARQEIRRMKGR